MSQQAFGVVVAAAQLGLSSILVKPHRAIGPFTAQVTLREQHTDLVEITDHPIDKGGLVTDHAFLRPSEVTIECAWSNSPSSPSLIGGLVGAATSAVAGVQSILSGDASGQVREVYQKLLALQSGLVPFDIYTGKRKYQNMMMRSLTVVTDKTTENSLAVVAICRQVILVSTRTLTISAPADKQANPKSTQSTANTGLKSPVPVTGVLLP